MVRLKANCTYVVLTDNKISIPYGAIKRVGNYAFRYSVFTFQFLMVRLKVLVNMHLQIVNSHFNSLWCD